MGLSRKRQIGNFGSKNDFCSWCERWLSRPLSCALPHMPLLKHPPPAAPTLVRAPSERVRPVTASPSAAAPAPRKKKPSAKKAGKKKATKAVYDSSRAGEEEGSAEFDQERWLEEQTKLTQHMSRMYSFNHGSSSEDYEDEGGEDEDEDDVLAYYDYEAEEKALKERVAELKRVSSLPPGAAAPSAEDDPEPSFDDLEEDSLTDAPGADDGAEAAAAAATAASAEARAPSPELEPFCIGRRPNAFEEIEIPIEAAAAVPSIAKGGEADSSAEPPLTPRSLASSIAARRQANQRMRADAAGRTTQLTSPTGA